MASSSQFIPTMESSSSKHFSFSTNDDSSSDGDQETVSQHYNKCVQKMTNLLLPPQMLTLISKPIERQYIKRDRGEAINKYGEIFLLSIVLIHLTIFVDDSECAESCFFTF
ncbi:hypothetical protein CsSME_00011923 [Camellia sinensis var. sinensis]